MRIGIDIDDTTVVTVDSMIKYGKEYSKKELNQKRILAILPKSFSYPTYPFTKRLELCISRCSRERNHVTDVCHTSYEEQQTFETKTETCVRT